MADGSRTGLLYIYEANFKERTSFSDLLRKTSVAFVGNNTIAELKSIAEESAVEKKGVEIGFIAKIGDTREIKL